MERLAYAQELVRERLGIAARNQSDWFDRSVRAKEFEVGAKVRVYNPCRVKGRTPKWQSYYEDIAVVLKRLNDATYLVKLSKGRELVVHTNKLKPYREWQQ
jgi:hypothetical protein